MAKRRMMKVKPLTKPTTVFNKNEKKPEADDRPGAMTGGKSPVAKGKPSMHKKRLKGVMI